MQETWVWFLGQGDPLEKEIAICSSILAWKTPWIEEPGQLQSMGSQKVEHDWACSQGYALGFPDGLVGKESICSAGDTRDLDSIPGSGRSPGEGNGNPLQYSCLKNPVSYSPKGYKELDTTKHTHKALQIFHFSLVSPTNSRTPQWILPSATVTVTCQWWVSTSFQQAILGHLSLARATFTVLLNHLHALGLSSSIPSPGCPIRAPGEF